VSMERRSCLMQCKCAISNYGTWPTPDRIAVDRHLIRCCCHTRIVSEGTSPAGSMWAKNPIPRSWRNQTGGWGIGSNQMQTGEGFQPVCVDTGMDKNGNLRSCTSEWGEHCLSVQTPHPVWPPCRILSLVLLVIHPVPCCTCVNVFGSVRGTQKAC
jgi:hypothetical protein